MKGLADTAGLLLVLLGIPSAVGAVVFRPARRLLAKVSQFLDDWAGEPPRPGVPARPGVMERLRTIETNQAAGSEESQQTRGDVKRALAAQEKRTAAVLADMDVNLNGVVEQIETIHKELIPNGGGSLKDQVTRVDRTLHPGDARDVAEDHESGEGA